MTIKQVSVFVENTSGRLAEVTRVLAKNQLNLRAISVADTADFGILRIIVDSADKAAEVLEAGGFTAKLTEVIGVEVPDRPGGLADVMEIFDREKVNIEYLYTSLERNRENAVVIFKVADLELGLRICEKNNLSVVSGF
jgi:hypothetical protein